MKWRITYINDALSEQRVTKASYINSELNYKECVLPCSRVKEWTEYGRLSKPHSHVTADSQSAATSSDGQRSGGDKIQTAPKKHVP